MWYQRGKAPEDLPSVIVNSEGETVSNPSLYPEATLNSWGWFKCPTVKSHDTFYYTCEWQEPNWVYIPIPYEERLAHIDTKQKHYICLLQAWAKEAVATALDSTSSKLTNYVKDIEGEIRKIKELTNKYKDASIQDTLADLNNLTAAKTADADYDPPLWAKSSEKLEFVLHDWGYCNSDTSRPNARVLDFWYNYTEDSISVPTVGEMGF